MSTKKAARVRVRWDETTATYKVGAQNWDGGEMVAASDYDELLKLASDLRNATDLAHGYLCQTMGFDSRDFMVMSLESSRDAFDAATTGEESK